MEMDEEGFKRSWKLLKNAIQDIQEKENRNEISFEKFYRIVYTMVVRKYGERLYTGLKEVISQHLETKVRQEMLCALDNNFLQTLNEAWIDHKMSMTMIKELLMYMERSYIRINQMEDVYDVGLIIFRDEVSFFNRSLVNSN